MPRTNGPIITAALLASLVAGPAAAQQPPIDVGGLAAGTHGRMTALLEKTFLDVNVLRVDVRVDQPTARKIAQLARGERYSDELARRIARTAYRAENAYVRTRFERDVELDDFVEAVRSNLEKAWRAGMISEESYRGVSSQLPRWFGFLRERGFQEGDWLLYRARPNSLRTVVLDADGKELLDQTDRGSAPRLALLAGYFAPGSEIGELLIRSLFD